LSWDEQETNPSNEYDEVQHYRQSQEFLPSPHDERRSKKQKIDGRVNKDHVRNKRDSQLGIQMDANASGPMSRDVVAASVDQNKPYASC
jgi:hypothetical protein